MLQELAMLDDLSIIRVMPVIYPLCLSGIRELYCLMFAFLLPEIYTLVKSLVLAMETLEKGQTACNVFVVVRVVLACCPLKKLDWGRNL